MPSAQIRGVAQSSNAFRPHTRTRLLPPTSTVHLLPVPTPTHVHTISVSRLGVQRVGEGTRLGLRQGEEPEAMEAAASKRGAHMCKTVVRRAADGYVLRALAA